MIHRDVLWCGCQGFMFLNLFASCADLAVGHVQAARVLWLLSQPFQADGKVWSIRESASQRAHTYLCQYRCVHLVFTKRLWLGISTAVGSISCTV